MTTHSDADERQTEGQRQEAMPFDPPNGDSKAQARRARVRAREAERTTRPTTDRDVDTPRELPEWLLRAGRYARRQAFMREEPVPAGEVWQRAAYRAGMAEGWLPTAWVYGGGAVGCALTGALLSIAWLTHQPFGGGPVQSLTGLWDRVEDTAARVDGPYIQAAIRAVGVLAWGTTASCYATAYIVQFPALLLLLAICGGIAFLTTLF